ncbi:hypothetical protein K492DRAFT_210185 [Lichtheimia hyalospora FSU 10163]|nr:hypothetical protein K492DRAFT_210185 [Lichtheimia hyalospora FSU 10163]
MESELGELAGSFQKWSQHLDDQKKLLETEIDRLKTFQQDHNALEKQLKTLPDKTTRSAMIPIGSLAFMPGKFIHTNEITVYLGSNYYVERSAKQALEILERRKQVVKDNLQLLEEQLEGLSSKQDAKFGAFPSSDMGVNEEGLPIMEIREELPEESNQQQPSSSEPEPSKPIISSVTEKVTSTEKPVTKDNQHMKGVMALLEQLGGEEDDEEDDIEQEEKSLRERIMEHEKEEESDEDTDDDELDDRYDTEIADNLFDHFDDDEEYATEGVVEQEDATIHDENDNESQPEAPPSVSNVIESTVQETTTVNDSSKEESKADQQEPRTTEQPTTETPLSTPSEPVSKPKKVSRFKAARNEDRLHTVETTNTSHQPTSTSMDDQQIPAVKPVTSSVIAPKKVSKFKAARQQHAEIGIPSVETIDNNAPSSETLRKNQEQSIPKVQQQISAPQVISTSEQPTAPTQQRGIPVVESSSKKKKTSRFKAARQQARESKTTIESSAAPTNNTPAKDENGKRRVTWDEVATVQEHDRSAAPSEATSSDTYTSPVKQESNHATTIPQVIRSPADIFKVVKAQRQILLDDGYPALDTGEDTFDESESTVVTMDELRHSANLGKQELWQLKVEPDNPLIFNDHPMPQEQSSLPKMPKNKLDTNIMKGAVLEREIEAVDLEQVEADMDLREVTSSYHQKKYDIVAAMGGYTFESKDTFEVVDEELPLPSAQAEKKASQPKPEEKPKKMSRFKAARLAKLDRPEE